MNNFTWKRKIGVNVDKSKTVAFSCESKDENDEIQNDEIDWLTLAPKRMCISLEDPVSKSERLRQEGALLAESERYWEAIKKWDEALQFTPNNKHILEMKAQALMALGEVFPAVQTAEKTVEIAPTWWIAHQTLGRALANVGEVKMAIKSFSRAIHLNPSDPELWTEDLIWAKSLLARKMLVSEEDKVKSTVTITEVTEGDDTITSCQLALLPYSDSCRQNDLSASDSPQLIKKLPTNYVKMRD